MFRTTLVTALVGFALTPAHAQVAAKFVVDGLVNCSRPPVRGFPLHIEGTGQLSGQTGTLSLGGNVANATYNVKLGRKAEAEAGSAALRVTGRSSLRAIRDYPNNTVYVDLKVTGRRCAITVSHRLKPGRTEYTFMTPLGLAICDKPVITAATCTPL